MSTGAILNQHLLGKWCPNSDKKSDRAHREHPGSLREPQGAPGRPKGPPKGAQWHPKGAQGQPKGSPMGAPKSSPRARQRHTREAKGTRYIFTNSRSTAQAAVMLIIGEGLLIHRRAYVHGWICLKTDEIQHKIKEIPVHSPPLGARARARPRGGCGHVFLLPKLKESGRIQRPCLSLPSVGFAHPHTMACHGMPWHAMPWHAMACHAMAWPMACHAMACHAMPWHGMAYGICHIRCSRFGIRLGSVGLSLRPRLVRNESGRARRIPFSVVKRMLP